MRTYTENNNEQEDSDQWYDQLNFQNYNSQTIDHEELKELICRTAAYPLRSSETMDLIAAVASVAKKEMHLEHEEAERIVRQRGSD